MDKLKALKVHKYKKDRQSGAGNCVCGRAYASVIHPHTYARALNHPHICVCGKTREEGIHAPERRQDRERFGV